MKKCVRISFIVLFLMFVFCSTTNITENIIKTSLDSITEGELRETLTVLASDEMEGRLAGEKGCEKAAEYIAKEFEKYGVTPGMGNSYFQHFDFIEGFEKSDNSSLSLEKNKEIIEFEYDIDYHILPEGINTHFKGEIAFTGYSITNNEYDDYAEIDVEGKIVIALRSSPLGASDKSLGPYFSTKVFNAINHGAKGFILVNSPKLYPDDPQLKAIFLGDLKADIPILQMTYKGANKLLALEGYDIKTLQEEIDSNYKSKSFLFENVEINLVAELIKLKEETYNVVGYFPGKHPELKNEVIIVGGHYDHIGYGEIMSMDAENGKIHNGADDNASGISSILEVAEAFSFIKDKINRTILFIGFSAEEYGLFGSQYYTSNPIFPIEDTILMCNVHKVGLMMYEEVNAGYSNETINKLLEELGEQYPFELLTDEDTDSSSQNPFYNSGVPIAIFSTGFQEGFHTSNDDVEHINFEGLTQITKMIFEFIYTIDSQIED